MASPEGNYQRNLERMSEMEEIRSAVSESLSGAKMPKPLSQRDLVEITDISQHASQVRRNTLSSDISIESSPDNFVPSDEDLSLEIQQAVAYAMTDIRTPSPIPHEIREELTQLRTLAQTIRSRPRR